MAMIPIHYRDFYDVPRAFIVNRAGGRFLFDCPFDEASDEYPDRYSVYRLDSDLQIDLNEGSWSSLASRATLVGHVLVGLVAFDETRRSMVDESVFALLTDS